MWIEMLMIAREDVAICDFKETLVCVCTCTRGLLQK